MYEYAKRLVAVISRSGNVRGACVDAGIHHSTYYRWRKRFERGQPVQAKAKSWADRQLEAEVVALALANPGYGPQRLSDELALRNITVCPSRVWRILGRHRLNTRKLRYQLLDEHREPVEPRIVVAVRPDPPRHLEADRPGDLVGMDCFHVGSFKETRLGQDKGRRGQIWQYTAIDVASSWLWVELEASPHNPDPAITSRLAHRVARDLIAWGWTWKKASTDNGNEFVANTFVDTLKQLGVTHQRIRAGRPQSNGKAERVQGTLLEEFYQPTLIGYVEPSITGLRADLQAYVATTTGTDPTEANGTKAKPPPKSSNPKTGSPTHDRRTPPATGHPLGGETCHLFPPPGAQRHLLPQERSDVGGGGAAGTGGGEAEGRFGGGGAGGAGGGKTSIRLKGAPLAGFAGTPPTGWSLALGGRNGAMSRGASPIRLRR